MTKRWGGKPIYLPPRPSENRSRPTPRREIAHARASGHHHRFHAMLPCLSEATTMPGSFAEDVDNFASAGCQAMEVWLTKLEAHIESQDASTTKRMLDDRGMKLVAAAYQGGLLLSQGEARKAHFDHFRKRLDICQAFAIPTMLVVADFAEAIDQTALERSVVSLAQAAQWASAFGVSLALEFRGKNAFCSSLDTAIALVEQCGEPNVGVNFDVFHFYTGPSKLEDFRHLTADRLAHVQFCDLSGASRELATDADRILPGDGDFCFEPILEHLRALGYKGYVSLELMNPMIWRADAKQVAEIGITSLRKILGLADDARAGQTPPGE